MAGCGVWVAHNTFRLIQYRLCSLLLPHGWQSSLPHDSPSTRAVENMSPSLVPPASWYLTLNLVILASSSSLSFNIFISWPPLVDGTKITVLVWILSSSFPAFWNAHPGFPALSPPSTFLSPSLYQLFLPSVFSFHLPGVL